MISIIFVNFCHLVTNKIIYYTTNHDIKEQVQKSNFWDLKGRGEFLKRTATGRLKVYAYVDSEMDKVLILPAYKCPTNPAMYVHVNFDHGNQGQSVYQVIYKIKHPRPAFEHVMFQLRVAVDMVEGK